MDEKNIYLVWIDTKQDRYLCGNTTKRKNGAFSAHLRSFQKMKEQGKKDGDIFHGQK